MEPVSAVLAASTAATAGEVSALSAATLEAKATGMTFAEGAEFAEAGEMIVGEKGLLEQMDTIRHSSLESVVARNENWLDCRNTKLEGMVHPETQVLFAKDIINLPDGGIVEGVFPEFNTVYECNLSKGLMESTDYRQFREANTKMGHAVESSPELQKTFTENQLQQIQAGDTPDGYTWHHHQEPARMQLVDTEVHFRTGHTGGKEIWGGGR